MICKLLITLLPKFIGGYEHLVELLKRQEKRREIGVPVDCKLLLSVGELSIRKNHKVVVEALQELPEDYWYVIVGKGDLKEELEQMDTTGRLRLLGFRTDINELLWASDLFAFPSLQEGLPVALMEAMAAGVPCVASDIRGNRDLIKDERYLFEARDKWACYKTINQCLQEIIYQDPNIANYDSCFINKTMKGIYQQLLYGYSEL